MPRYPRANPRGGGSLSFLRGIRVVEACYGRAGPLATQLLADYAAEIIRVDAPAAERDAGDLVRLRGRRSIALDLDREEGRALLLELATRSDVLIEEPRTDGRSPTGVTYERLAALNPRLVYCRISAYGDHGPLAGSWQHDHLAAARYGVYNQAGWREGPTYVHPPIPSLAAAFLAVQAIGVALYQRERTGKGQEVSTSLLAGALAVQTGIVSAANDQPAAATPVAGRSPFGAAPFYSIYECADGRWLHFGCLTPQFQTKATEAIALQAELAELGFGTPAAADNRTRIIERVAERMKERPYAEWAALFERLDVPHAPSQLTDDLFDDPQVRHEGLIVTIDDPRLGAMAQMGAAAVIEGEAWQTPRPAPAPGEHTDAICRELGLGAEAIARLRTAKVIA